jgi:hypothetical protein
MEGTKEFHVKFSFQIKRNEYMELHIIMMKEVRNGLFNFSEKSNQRIDSSNITFISCRKFINFPYRIANIAKERKRADG